MESAKTAVKSFLSKDGHHDTTVHTNTNEAVTNEIVDKHRHDNIIKATDREVHQDHYHTTVQPIHDTQKLKEQHHFKTAAVEHRKFEHGNDEEVQRRLQSEQEKFQNTTREGETKHTTAVGGNLQSEHIHHHVHENIQPIIERQTIEPHVVHTTIPVHETHHSAAQHHSATSLPPVSLEEFQAQGGTLGGQKHKEEFFEGEPRDCVGHVPHDGAASHEFRETGHVSKHGEGHHIGSNTTTRTGVVGDGLHSNTTGTGVTGGHHAGTAGTGVAADGHHSGKTSTTTTTGTAGTKPSLLDRLNPLKDADGDGKKGIMD